jgi:acyl-CoA synthetase
MQNILTLHDPQRAREYYLDGVWQQDTLYTLARRHAREQPTACALRDAELRLTWREVTDWADSVGEALHRQGLRAGDRVGVWLPNVVETVVVLLACSRNGYVCCPSLHQNYTVEEIAILLERIDCKALIAAPGYGADSDRHSIFARAASMSTLNVVYAIERHAHALHPEDKAIPFPDRVPPAVTRAPDLNPDKITYLAFTSGTTGMPKGVMHSDNTLLANGRALTYDWGHTSETILLSLSPMSHHIATVGMEQWLVVGFEFVMTDSILGKKGLEWVLETGATYVLGVPTHAMDILGEVAQRGLRELGRVKTFYMAGAAIPREVAQKFMNLGVAPQNIYGMTENGSHQYTLPDDSPDIVVSTCGRACKGYEVKLWKQDDPDTEVAVGEVGEIGGRGGLLMLGYFSNQGATEQSFNRHGWFMSGDLGVVTDDQCLRIVGRKKDLIIRGGHNIHPARIEELAMRHHDLERAAAYPVPDDRLGEKVCLAVIPRQGKIVDPDSLLRHLAEVGLSKYDMPEYYVELSAFPMTASGKILKRRLIDMTRAGEVTLTAVRYTARPAAEAVAGGAA